MEGHHQEWSLWLNLTRHGKTYVDSFEDEFDDCITAEFEFSSHHCTLALALLEAVLRALIWCLKQCFTQNNGPSHSYSPNVVTNFLQQLGLITFLHSATSHFSKPLSSFRHFKHNLHLWSIRDWQIEKLHELESRCESEFLYYR